MSIHFTKLSSGIRVVTRNLAHAKSTALALCMEGGARGEAQHTHGMAHFLEHMAFKGTHRRSARQIVEDIENLGGDINAETSMEATIYTARMLSDDYLSALDVLSDIVQNMALHDHDIATERSVIEQEISAIFDSPDDHILDLLTEQAYQNQAIGRTILGTSESIAAINAQSLRDFHQQHYRADAMIISAAGSIDHEVFCRDVERLFAPMIGRKIFDNAAKIDHSRGALYTGGFIRELMPIREAHFVLALPGFAYHDNGLESAHACAHILGGSMSSRLFQEVRELRGLCYHIDAFHWAFRDTGIFGIQCATDPGTLIELADIIRGELERFSATIEPREINRAKMQMQAGLIMGDENVATIAMRLARQTLAFSRPLTLDDQLKRIHAIGPDSIRMTMEHLMMQPVTMAMIGPETALKSASRCEQQFMHMTETRM